MIGNCTREMDFFPANFMLQTKVHTHEDDYHHQPSTSLSTLDIPQPQEFHGVASFMGKRSLLFSAGIHHHYRQQHEFFHEEGNGNGGAQMDDLSDDDDESQAGREKKRRLNLEQVKTLEKNFELANKLEPEKKLQLARALGLQPRQIAIWFQNRRARWKTKQLEKEYQLLKREFDAIKAENDSLQSQNHKLHAQILALKNGEATESINLNKETEGSCSENSSDIIKLDISTRTGPATDSHPNITKRPFFQSDRQPSDHVAQLFQNDNNNQKTEHHQPESLCNMFCGIDDQTGYWPWLEHQQFN